MTDFDKLAQQAFLPEATIEDKNALWSATFDLEQWHCIPRGNFPDVYPYTTYLEENKAVLLVFTDTTRAKNYAVKNIPHSTFEDTLLLSLPSNTAPDYFAKFAANGVWGVWFNAGEMGYYAPLEGLPRIKAHLENLKRG
jgi:hypothetical protein